MNFSEMDLLIATKKQNKMSFYLLFSRKFEKRCVYQYGTI